MKLQTINISTDNTPFEIIVELDPRRDSTQWYRNHDTTQQYILKYRQCIEILEQWDVIYRSQLPLPCIFNPAGGEIRVNNYLAPKSLSGLKRQMKKGGFFYVSDEGSMSNDWSKSVNVALRHLHDIQHLHFDKTTSFKDELFLATRLADQVLEDCQPLLRASPKSTAKILWTIIHTDFKYQSIFYKYHNEFVGNQGLFLRTCLLRSPTIFKHKESLQLLETSK